ncbi:MAG: autotransporter outer membrane beta-barrel domain-containing protein [Negativicutes bacterium]
MNCLRRVTTTGVALFIAIMFMLPFPLASAETMADIDAEIQTDRTLKRDSRYDAYNIYAGVTDPRLDRKIDILKTTGVSNRFYQRWDSGLNQYVPVYDNFYSFTSLAGVTDTQLDIATTAATQRLYRRGSGTAPETTRGYFGAWWGDRYRGIEASRNEQAILAAWGSDLQRIYVIDVPAGYTLVGGVASPMERNGEYRPGGAYQYYYSGNYSTMSGWVVYALYAPDYLKSYSGAVTSAQKAGRSIAADLGAHLNQTRYEGIRNDANGESVADTRIQEPSRQEGDFWLRGFGGNVDYSEMDGSSVNSQTAGMSIGWQRMTSGRKPGDKSRSYFGVMLGQSSNYQRYGIRQYGDGNVENRTRATVGGIYGLYVNRPDSSRSWYGNWSLLHGGLSFSNTMQGELVGTGLKQDYNGNITIITLENGVSFRQSNGWVLEPQLQFSYTKIRQNDFNDNLGALVSLKKGDSLWGRLGLEARRTIVYTPERKSRYWARASYVHEFSGRNEVDIAGDRAISESKKNSCVLAIGADLQLSRKFSLQGEIAKVFGGEKGLQGNLALKYSW